MGMNNCDGNMDSGFASPSTPIVDERAYSPVSAAGDEAIRKLPNDEFKTATQGFIFFDGCCIGCQPQSSFGEHSNGNKRTQCMAIYLVAIVSYV